MSEKSAENKESPDPIEKKPREDLRQKAVRPAGNLAINQVIKK